MDNHKAQYKNIKTTDALKTFDFGDKEGTPQTDKANKTIHNNIVNNPDKPMFDEGETFNEAVQRVVPLLEEVVKTSPANTTLVTHNSVYGLIKLWDKNNRPKEFSKDLREAYAKQDNQFPTGSFFRIKGDKGDIIVVRHGETTDNAKKVFRTAKAELTDKGIKEATGVGKKLQNVDIPQIISSSLPRAVHTSNLIMDEHKNNK
jgi:broad specificity phosphatase PhoE